MARKNAIRMLFASTISSLVSCNETLNRDTKRYYSLSKAVASSSEPDDFFAEHLAAMPVLAVLRGSDPAGLLQMAEDCWAAGIELVEVSLSHDPDLTALRLVCQQAAGRGRVAGAGTVCSPDQVRAVTQAGAAFAVAPGLNAAAVQAAQALGLPYLPGITTPSEIQAALELGCRTLKLFPASLLGPEWLQAVSRPFPTARFVAVGGVTAANAAGFLGAGAIGVAIGSGLEPRELRHLIASITGHRSGRETVSSG
jgi:2-dehydro-3-deoxyphosphogluconate aldolase / (4S)-4-hydroxy-2-oxoglutarate aldolase